MHAPLILIVDDEDHIGMFAALILKRAGFQTQRATNVQAALELFSDRVDLLLTDWAMPVMNGDELAVKLRESKPGLKVLFMSGNVELAMRPDLDLKSGVNFLEKPFGSEELLSIVKTALPTTG